MDDSVKRWRLRGHVYLWRYKGNAQNYPGWHLTADVAGCGSLLELIDLIGTSRFSSQAKVLLSVPGHPQLSAPNAGLPYTAAKSLDLYHSPTKLAPDHWQLEEINGRVCLEFGRKGLIDFRQGIVDVARYEGDYSIGSAGQQLWFW
jgi:hypothetical protein